MVRNVSGDAGLPPLGRYGGNDFTAADEAAIEKALKANQKRPVVRPVKRLFVRGVGG